MKVAIVVAVAVLAVAFAKPVEESVPVARIITSDFDQQPEGAYNYNFQTDNGIIRNEVAEIRTVKDAEGHDQQILAIKGSYSFVDPATGQEFTVNYTADEEGYKAEGAHIPKPARK